MRQPRSQSPLQDALKQKVRAVCRAKEITLHENYADPRALAALVLDDLTVAIDAEFPADQVPDVWSREDGFILSHSAGPKVGYVVTGNAGLEGSVLFGHRATLGVRAVWKF